MGYTVVDCDDVEAADDRPCEMHRLTEAAGLSEMAINRFRAEPGEDIPLAYHYHAEQEEAFYVLSGTLFVETPDETYEVEEGCLFAVEPDSPQRAHNPADAASEVVVLAVGAPNVSGDVAPYEPDER